MLEAGRGPAGGISFWWPSEQGREALVEGLGEGAFLAELAGVQV